jgi:4-hydroxy-tetrahydrodipicolinate reductase
LTLRVAVHGASGRMGRRVVAIVAETADVALAAAIDRGSASMVGQDAGALAGLGTIGVSLTDRLEDLRLADVVIDFSLPEGTATLAAACAEYGVPLVSGTTGLDVPAESALDSLAADLPVVHAPNMSVGVTILFHLAARATALAGAEFDAEIVEMHYRHKVDAPSGTAARLARVVADAKHVSMTSAARYGRSGRPGARGPGEIGVMALRGGDVVGEHTLVLAGPGERIELTHRAHSRDIFAQGAVRAARWVVGRAPGRYAMEDVLELG